MSVQLEDLEFSCFDSVGGNRDSCSTTTGSYNLHYHDDDEQGVECIHSNDDSLPLLIDVDCDEDLSLLALDDFSQVLHRQLQENSPSLLKLRLRIDDYHGSTFRLILRSLAENTVLRKLVICRSPNATTAVTAAGTTTTTTSWDGIDLRRSKEELRQLFAVIQDLPKLKELVLHHFEEDDMLVVLDYLDHLSYLKTVRVYMNK